jgi:glycine oxidase
MHVLIKGTGVAGLVTAFELVRRGISVAIMDKAPAAMSGVSRYAGGMLAPYCEREAAEESILVLGLSSADWWESALPDLVHRKGTLVVAQPRDQADLKRFAVRTSGHRWLDAGPLADLEPALAGRFSKGLLFDEEAHLDPRAAMAGLYDRLLEQGVRFHFGSDRIPAGRMFDRIVDCTGPAAIGRLRGLRGVRGEMLYLETNDVSLTRPVRMLHPRHPIYVVPRGNGLFMLGATMIEADDDGPITARSLMELLNAAYALHPAFGEARIIETGTGVRPAFADNVPRIVETAEGLAVAGMHRHGFLLAPALAQQVADRITGKISPSERLIA